MPGKREPRRLVVDQICFALNGCFSKLHSDLRSGTRLFLPALSRRRQVPEAPNAVITRPSAEAQAPNCGQWWSSYGVRTELRFNINCTDGIALGVILLDS